MKASNPAAESESRVGLRGLAHFGPGPLSLQVAIYLAVGVVAIVAGILISGAALRSSVDSGDQANAALLHGQIEANALRLQALIDQQAEALASNPLLTLEADRILRESVAKAGEASLLSGSDATRGILNLTEASQASFRAFLANPDLTSSQALGQTLGLLATAVSTTQPQLTQLANDNHASLESGIRWALAANLVIVILAFGFITTTAVRRARSLQGALVRAESELETIADATRGLNKKNEQLAALYQVVTEVAGTLSLRYVVETTVDQAKNLTSLIAQIAPNSNLSPQCKHFFAGAACYAGGVIFCSLTPAGLALKLPEGQRTALLASGAEPLRYFSNAPIKKQCVVLPRELVADSRRLADLLRLSIEHVRDSNA